jgi:hypothetical protein
LIMEREVIDIAANLITAYREPYYRESWMGGKPSAFREPFTASANLIVFITAKMNGREGLTWLYFVRVKVHGRTANEPNALRGVIGNGWGWRTDAVKTDLGEFVSQIYLGIARTCTHTARTTIHIHVRQASNIN